MYTWYFANKSESWNQITFTFQVNNNYSFTLSAYVRPPSPEIVVLEISGTLKYVWRSQVNEKDSESKRKKKFKMPE